jgi:hypothetical protein
MAPTEFRNHDIFQVLAYCETAMSKEGLLIYPLHELDTRDEIRIRNSEVIIRRVSVDLDGDLGALRNALDRLADDVYQSAKEIAKS